MADFDPQAYLKDKLGGNSGSNGDFDPQRYLAEKAGSSNQSDTHGSGLLHTIMKPLDYAGGLTRTAAAALAGATKDGDWTSAAKGDAPSSADYLRRMDLPDGSLSDLIPGVYGKPGDGTFKPNKGGFLDPSAKGTAGFALDVALDPLTYASAGLSALGKAGELGKFGRAAEIAANPVAHMGEAGGKALYKSGLTAADQAAATFGKDAASDLLWKNRIKGTAGQIADKSSQLADQLLSQRGKLLKDADAAGASLDMNKAMSRAQDEINAARASEDPALQKIADTFQGKIDEYKGLNARPDQVVSKEVPSAILGADGKPLVSTVQETIPGKAPVNASRGTDFKTSLYNLLGDSAFKDAAMTNYGKDLQKKMARGLKEEVEAAANRAQAGLGDKIGAVNNDLGTLLTVQDTLDNQALKEGRKHAVTPVDAMVYSLGHGSGTAIPALATKKAVQAVNSPWFKTNAGMAIHDLSQIRGADPIVRRLLEDASQDPEQKNPWGTTK